MKVRKILTMVLATALVFGMTSNIFVPNTFYAKESTEDVSNEFFDDNKTVCTVETVDVDIFDDNKTVCTAETIDVDISTFTSQNKGEAYSNYLSRRVEEDFTSIEGIKLVNAIVTYDEPQDQYSIELSLITDEEISEEQTELYKSILRKTYVEVKLTINGVLR